MPHDTIVVLDYGSQTAQLIARRVRESGVYSELLPWSVSAERIKAINPKGIILSGGPNSVYEPGAPTLPGFVLELGVPILGICYGMQAITHALGGRVAASQAREYGPATLHTNASVSLWAGLPADLNVWMSHGDRIEAAPQGFVTLAHTSNSPIAAMGDLKRQIYGIQFHPEVTHTPRGTDFLANFAINICRCNPDWTPEIFVEESIARIREQVGEGRVLLGLSGGVDSSVVAALMHRAIGDRLISVFIDHGMLRKGEAQQVIDTFQQSMGLNLVAVNAVETFLDALDGVTDPEQKRRIIGELFVRTFEKEARRISSELGDIAFLAQGTIYPDVIESAAADRPDAHRIKSHHNVAGLPDDMQFDLVEPLRYLFKDEVRRVGEALGLPEAIVWRQPFPGPGLAVRCLGEITWERLERLRDADAIFTGELRDAEMLRGETSQAFAVLLPVQSVGVMGDHRTYAETVALRAVVTDDFMTADWAQLPPELLARVSARIVNEVEGVNRVVYDITTKPPATIEWE
ncbi:MAG: glutamine-hydrolyzing GMP synthase [Anaerolineae bacterium]|nr:glutamine-hydrolyzing GMP synthase [Anaerolineae bacterium]